jgi:hypothetical protein
MAWPLLNGRPGEAAPTPNHLFKMHIEIDDLSRPQVHALLQEHLDNMHELSPPEQVFALDLSKLKVPEITVWTIWDGPQLLGCGALKELAAGHGEIKSMRTPTAAATTCSAWRPAHIPLSSRPIACTAATGLRCPGRSARTCPIRTACSCNCR